MPFAMLEYSVWTPEGRAYLVNMGFIAAGDAVQDARPTGDFLRGKKELRVYADEQFLRWWKEQVVGHRHDDLNSKFSAGEVDHMRRVFTTAFLEHYVDSRNTYDRRNPPKVTVCIVKEQHARSSHVYEIELADPQHLANPVRAEIEVTGDGDTELREPERDD